MALRDQPVRVTRGGEESRSWGPIVVIPILALIANVGAYDLAIHGRAFVIPIEIIGGFAYRLAPLTPILEALILAFGLWWCTRLSFGRAVGAAVALLVFRVVIAIAVGYGLAIGTGMMSDALLTSAFAAFSPLFIATAFSGAALLLILALYDASFRSWWAWIVTLLIWAGGATLLFGLWRDSIVPPAYYPWLAQLVRALGFVVLGFQFGRSLGRQA